MSKKLDAIKKAVFYSQQKPEMLASYVADLITDVATAITVSGADKVTVATTGTATTSTYVGNVVSQYGDPMPSAEVAYSLKSAVTGVSINSSTGVLSVANTTTSESATVVATSGGKTAEKVVTLLVPTEVTIDGAKSINVPSSGGDAVTSKYTTVVEDQNGDTIENASVTFSLKSSVTGVSVSGDTVTVTDAAVAESFILVATCNSVTEELTVTLVPSN